MNFKLKISVVVLIGLILFFSNTLSFNAKIEDTQKKIDKVSNDIENELVEITDIENKISKKQSKIEELEDKKKNLEKESGDLEEQSENLRQKIDKNENNSEEFLKGFQKLINTNLFLDIFNDKSSVFERYKSLNVLLSNSKEKFTELFNSQNEIEDNKVEVDENIKSIDILEDEINKDEKNLEKQKQDSQNKIDQLNEQIAYLKEQKAIEIEYVSPDSFIDEDRKEELMKSAGIEEEDYYYANYIITKESNWNFSATNSLSGAYGLCQVLPPEKMTVAGDDWKTNPLTQLMWCNGYAENRYDGWEEAYTFHKENNWW